MAYAVEPDPTVQTVSSKVSTTAAPQRGYLFGPLTDFLYLGGGSLFVLAPLAILLPVGFFSPHAGALAIILMLLINQPHFAHSYQMFYRGFRAKAFGPSYGRALRFRYIFAGLVVPIGLVVFFAISIAIAVHTRSTELLGYAQNLFIFLTGWHYVKQGYGILIVDSIQKRLPFSESAKSLLRLNAYACWFLSWLAANYSISKLTSGWGIAVTTLAVPAVVSNLVLAIAVISTVAVLVMLVQAWRKSLVLPWNGLIAYLVTLYVWLLFADINPVVYMLVTSFHSLQYVTVVWRYQLNAADASNGKGNPGARSRLAYLIQDSVWRRLGLFVAFGILLGYLSFDGIPRLLDSVVPYDRSLFGNYLFVFCFWMFLNIHHYYLDNVMWRRGNPDIQQFLFSKNPPVVPAR